jgi:hypothetical protein
MSHAVLLLHHPHHCIVNSPCQHAVSSLIHVILYSKEKSMTSPPFLVRCVYQLPHQWCLENWDQLSPQVQGGLYAHVAAHVLR